METILLCSSRREQASRDAMHMPSRITKLIIHFSLALLLLQQAGAVAAMLDEGEAVMIDPAELQARAAAEQAANAGGDEHDEAADKPKFDELTAAEMNVSGRVLRFLHAWQQLRICKASKRKTCGCGTATFLCRPCFRSLESYLISPRIMS